MEDMKVKLATAEEQNGTLNALVKQFADEKDEISKQLEEKNKQFMQSTDMKEAL